MKNIKVNFANKIDDCSKSVLVLLLSDSGKLDLSSLTDQELAQQITTAYENAKLTSAFTAKKDSKLILHGLSGTIVLLMGLGKELAKEEKAWVKVGADVARAVAQLKLGKVVINCPTCPSKEQLADVSLGFLLGNYTFNKYISKELDRRPKPTVIEQLVLVSPVDSAKAEAYYLGSVLPVATGVLTARNLGNEPANVMTTSSMRQACEELTYPGLTVKVLDEKQMAAMNMNALLAVGQGSDQESYAVFMSWNGKPGKDTDIAIIGKGVVFDSGGISLKPGRGMGDMKFDMCGSAAVIGLMRALAERKAPVNVLGVVGLVENMPSGKAQRPGDIVTSMSGQTIEVTNTDAEGRLVLADLITCTQLHYKPKVMIDMATLTGSVIAALGHKHAGLYTNSASLATKLEAAGKIVDEKLWNMPMDEHFDAAMDSQVADMLNAEPGGMAGNITAAKFLERFVDKDVQWAHLDIAGTGFIDKKNEVSIAGSTGFGVRLLNRLISANFE